MFEKIGGFFQVIPIGYWITIVTFIILAVAVWLTRRRWKKMNHRQNRETREPINTEEESIGMLKEPSPSTRDATNDPSLASVQPAAATVISGNIDSTATKLEKMGQKIQVGPQYKYRAVIKWYPKPGRTPIIEFNNKIDRPLGGLYFLEPSCPVTGEAYFIEQHEDGTFSAYEPRGDAILSDKTPYLAWDALHWPRVEGVWGKKAKSWLEGNVGNILLFGMVGMTFILALVRISG